MNRRGFLLGVGAIAAPAIIRTSGLLMPVRPLLRLQTYKVLVYLVGPGEWVEVGQVGSLVQANDIPSGAILVSVSPA